MPEIAIGCGFSNVRLNYDGRIVHLSLDGEIATNDVLAIMVEAQDRGWLSPRSRLMLDVSRFSGCIDWAAVRAIKALPCWGDARDRETMAAYIVRDSTWGFLIRAASTIFSVTQHRFFMTEFLALEWLLSDKPNRP